MLAVLCAPMTFILCNVKISERVGWPIMNYTDNILEPVHLLVC